MIRKLILKYGLYTVTVKMNKILKHQNFSVSKITFNLSYALWGCAYLRVNFNLSYTLLGGVYSRVTFNLFYTFLGSVYLRVTYNLLIPSWVL